MAVAEERVYRLRADEAFDRVGSSVDSQNVAQAFATRRGIWISSDAKYLTRQLTQISPKNTWNRLLLLTQNINAASLELLSVYFRSIVCPVKGIKLLEHEELAEVLAADQPEDYFIGGLVNFEDESLILYRGNLEPIVVSFAWFLPTSQGLAPDFHQFSVTDCGQTIALGAYEAATDAILYEFSTDARKRMKSRALRSDESLGAAIRRLRLQKGLSLKDFPNVSEKTLGRIERGEVKTPHKQTIADIALHLGVKPEAIDSY